MLIRHCCFCNSKKPIKQISGDISPNVKDVYLDPFNQFEPITTQPYPVQRKPRKSLNNKLVNDMKKDKNDPEGFNNFAFVDEIDLPVTTGNVNIINENQKNQSNDMLENSNQSLKTTIENENFSQSNRGNSDLNIDQNLDNNNHISSNLPSSLNVINKNNIGTLTIIKNGEKTVQTLDYENMNANIVIDNGIFINTQSSVKNTNLNESNVLIHHGITKSSDIENFDHRQYLTTPSCYSVKTNNNCTITITKNGEKIIVNSPLHNQNENSFQIANVTINNGKILIKPIENFDSDYIIENSFENFIENSGLKSHLDNTIYCLPIEQYASIKIQEDYLMTPTEVPRKILKRKFPHAFDKNIEKTTDLKRKPSTNLIISKVQLLKEIPSDYSYGSFRLASLDVHNKFRAKHGCPPLVESKELNEIAKDWANHLAINNYEIYHRPDNKFGENLYWTTNSLGNAKMAVQAWYNEIELYDYDNPEFSKETGHFTQVLWKETKELGTAIAKIGNSIWIVCNYNPPGNVQGRFNDFYVPRLIE